MFETRKADWFFIIPASLIWIFGLLLTALDFVMTQGMIYRFGFVNLTGLILGLIGVAIRRHAKKTLGRFFSYGLRTSKEHKLIRNGIYKYIRHPAYLGSLLFSFAIPSFFNSLYGFLIMLLLIPLFFYRIRMEEAILLEEFGEEYKDYMKNSKKMIPYIY